MANVGLDAIISLLDEVETRLNDYLAQATVLVDEAECVDGLLQCNLVQLERVRELLAQTVQLQLSIAEQRAILGHFGNS